MTASKISKQKSYSIWVKINATVLLSVLARSLDEALAIGKEENKNFSPFDENVELKDMETEIVGVME